MSTVRAEYYFEARLLFVRHELLGTEHRIQHHGTTYDVVIPPDNADPPWPPDSVTRPTSGLVEDPRQCVSLRVIRVDTDVRLPADPDPMVQWEDLKQKAAGPRAIAGQVLSWARARHGHNWLGVSSEPVRLIQFRLPENPNGLVVVHAGDPGNLALRPREVAIGPDAMAKIVADVSADTEPLLAENLMADAEYLAWHAQPRDLVRAVLLAAIAGEVKVKATLREKCSPVVRPLLDFTLDNPADVTVAAREHFHEVASSVLGRSLHADNRDLYKLVVRLYEIRNRIAHYGETPDRTEAESTIRAMRETFTWLDSMPVSGHDRGHDGSDPA